MYKVIPNWFMFSLLLMSTSQAIAVDFEGVELPAWALKPGRMVDIGDYSLNTYCFGTGTPVVVLEAGGGWGAVAWANVQEEMAKVTRVCSYDRAGSNFSDLGPVQRKPGQEAKDLRSWLTVAGETPPYIIVGWSAGGMIAREMAWDAPELVAAIVATDGSVFDFEYPNWKPAWRERAIPIWEACKADMLAGVFEQDPERLEYCESLINPVAFVPPLRDAFRPRVMDPDKWDQVVYGLGQNMDPHNEMLFKKRRSLGDMPLHILVAGEHADPGKDPFLSSDYLFRNLQIAELSSNSLVTIVPRTTHMIHYGRPDVVVRAVTDMVETVRRRTDVEQP